MSKKAEQKNNIRFEIEEKDDDDDKSAWTFGSLERDRAEEKILEERQEQIDKLQQQLDKDYQDAVDRGHLQAKQTVAENKDEADEDNPFDINWSERSSLNSNGEEGKGRKRVHFLHGGALPVKDIKELLKHSYDKQPSSHGDYELDPELSGQRVQVYKKKGSNQAVVVHRGTQGIHDWGNDLKYALGFDISNSNRLKHARDIQQKAEAKYGANNISTLGHSLGSKIARDVGQNSNEIINLNPAIAPQDVNKPKSDKEYDIRTSLDPVSALSNLTQNTNTITIPSQSFNPLTEHSTDTLDRLPQDQQIGRGHIKKMPMKHLKDLVKRMSGRKFPVTRKRKHELVEHVCHCCNIK